MVARIWSKRYFEVVLSSRGNKYLNWPVGARNDDGLAILTWGGMILENGDGVGVKGPDAKEVEKSSVQDCEKLTAGRQAPLKQR